MSVSNCVHRTGRVWQADGKETLTRQAEQVARECHAGARQGGKTHSESDCQVILIAALPGVHFH